VLLNGCGADIKADNIMFGIEDDSVFAAFEDQELLEPSARKLVDDDRAIYVSLELQMPKDWGAPVLCDFGSAVPGDMEHSEDVQPDIYRAPEVILEAPWSYQIDIWNAGCMVSTPKELERTLLVKELTRIHAGSPDMGPL
jgi:serine/threonine protein kinase